MASLLDLFKTPEKSKNPILNLLANASPLTRVATNAVKSRPVRKTIGRVQSVGNRAITNVAKRPIPQKMQPISRAITGIRTSQNPYIQLPQQFAGGIVQGSNLGLGTPPSVRPQTLGQKSAFTAGSLIGAMNPKSATGMFFRGVGATTNPILSRVTRTAGKAINPRVAGAGANILQGIGIDKTLGQKTTPTSLAIDAITGMAMGPNQFDDIAKTTVKGVGSLPKIKVQPDQVLKKRNVILNLAKLKEFGFRNKSGKGEINFEALKVIDDIHSEIFGLPSRNRKLRQLDYRQKVDELVDALNNYTIQQSMKDSGIKVGITEQPAKQAEKYSFNINKERLGLKGEAAKKLDTVVNEMKPVLRKNKGAPLTNKQIIEGGRKANMLDKVMTKQESAEFSKSLQASRNFLRTESKKKGLTPEFLAQLEIVSSQAADKGRSLRAFAVNAEDAGIKEAVLKDLQKLGVESKQLLEAAKNVDWENSKEVTEFYRKFNPAKFSDLLEEIRYTNMLSSPNTHINNAFSNLLQTAVVTPVEKTLTGTLDFAKSRLTGTEQKYFARQGVDYAKGYWKSLPNAVKKFNETMKGASGLRKPDIDFIPSSTSKKHSIFTTPLRMLEASDQFFKELVEGGEKQALKGTRLSESQILKKAEASAEYRLFRQAFDPQGKTDQGTLLKVWDKWNSGINSLRRLPGGKWLVPFLQTPTNILKQGVEYSPLGLATIPGAGNKMEQLSKAMLGTGVFAGAYALSESGLTQWDAPVSSKKRSEFYAAGLQPYSVKIGDKWVSYSKLGPLSYPIAMASAMKWAQDNGAEDDLLTNAGTGLGSFLQFFADQSYMRGIGDIIDAVRGDEFKQGRALANIPSQVIPYRSLQGWVARLVDPVYRKSTGGGVTQQATKSALTQVPVLSKSLEPYTTPSGEPSKRHFPLLNAVSPFQITQDQGTYTPPTPKAKKNEPIKIGKAFEAQAAEDIPLPKEEKKIKILYKDAFSTAKNYDEKVLKIQQDDTLTPDERQKKLDTAQESFDSAVHMINKIKQQQPEKIFFIQMEGYSKIGSATTEERADWAAEQIQSGDKSMIDKLYKGQVLTKSVVEALNEKYGLGLTKYNYGDGFRYLSKGGSSKKISVKSSFKPLKLKPLSFSKKPLNLKAPPKIPQSKFKFASANVSTEPIKVKPINIKIQKA